MVENEQVGSEVQTVGDGQSVPSSESEAVPSETGALSEVSLVAEQWQFVHDSLSWSLCISAASLLLLGAILGAILSHYLGRALNRG